MSPLVSAPSGAAPEPARVAPRIITPDRMTAAGLAGALALLAFITTGGADLAPNTWTEIALVAIGAAAAALVVRRPAAAGRYGLGTVLAFGALSALTALSLAWSLVPDLSWLEANRLIAYLAGFGAAIAAVRVAPARWRGVVGGIGCFAVGLSLWALTTKVFPRALDPVESFGRLRTPLDYWNATGIIAAMGFPPLAWAAARRQAGRMIRTFAVPSLGALFTALVLTASRSAMLATLCGMGLWLWLVPLRLRAAALLAGGALTALPPTAWALTHRALTHDRVAIDQRASAGHGFGLMLLGALLAGAAVAWRTSSSAPRVRLSGVARQRLGTALIVVVALVPVGLLVGATASSRGLTGEISHVWRTLTNPNGGTDNAPRRLVEIGNSRGLYWREGLAVGRHHPLAGAGAGAFAIARTRYTHNPGVVTHAHSYPVETFADLGALGLLVSLGLLVVWGRATARTFGDGPGSPQLDLDERAGLLTLLAVAVTFGAQSSVDWTWEIPGVALPALICAGWIAGRAPKPAIEEARSGLRPAAAPAFACLLAVALLAGWAIWQPLRSADSVVAAQDALVAGHGAAALTDARAAAAENPLSPFPLWTEADVLSATGRLAAARQALTDAVSLEPENPLTWRRLAQFDVTHARGAAAVRELERAQRLDPANPLVREALGLRGSGR